MRTIFISRRFKYFTQRIRRNADVRTQQHGAFIRYFAFFAGHVRFAITFPVTVSFVCKHSVFLHRASNTYSRYRVVPQVNNICIYTWYSTIWIILKKKHRNHLHSPQRPPTTRGGALGFSRMMSFLDQVHLTGYSLRSMWFIRWSLNGIFSVVILAAA